MSEQNPEPRFEFGGPCPPLKGMVFPYDPSLEPYEIEDKEETKDEQADPAQPS
jgi:hypothetical protein